MGCGQGDSSRSGMVYVGDSVTRRRDSAVHVKVRGRRGGERVSEGGCNDTKRVEVKIKVKEREQIKEEEDKRECLMCGMGILRLPAMKPRFKKGYFLSELVTNMSTSCLSSRRSMRPKYPMRLSA